MDAVGGSRHAGAPRTLDVQQFANARGAEVEALHAALQKDGSEGVVAIPRCLRRRTTSHHRRKSFFWQRKQKKRKHGAMDEVPSTVIDAESGRVESGSGDAAVIAKKPPCRRVRRRIELKGDEQGGGGCSRDGTQRLVTHVWHAKRFTMAKTWGHWLAEGLPGRGRGSRAVIRWATEAALLQDASFYSVIELEGSGKSITEALQLVLEPAPISVELMSPKDQAVYSGAEFGKAMLHHMGRCPHGAIAPVTFIWRPDSKAGEERRIWLWVHAAAFEEASACLQHLCQSQGVHKKERLQCLSRKGQLGRLDLLGSKAVSILQKVLRPVASQTSQGGCVEAVPSSTCDSSSLIASLEDPLQVPGAAVVGMEVWDPRCRPHSDMMFEPSVLVEACSDVIGIEDMDVTDPNSPRSSTFDQLDDNGLLTAANPESKNLQCLRLERTERRLSGSRKILDCLGTTGQGRIVKPSSEKDLSNMRHKKRLSYFQLNNAGEETQEELSVASESVKCPILVLRHVHQRASACGFSLILPIAWVRAFWVPLVFAGGHVIGLRERHWLHTDANLPSFPHDYPDCSSYDEHMAKKAAEDQETYNKRPRSKRGLWKSGLPDWKFANETRPLDSVIRSIAQGVLRAEFGADTSCGAACESSDAIPGKPFDDDIVSLSSTGPEAPSTQLEICNILHHVQTGDSEAGAFGAAVTEISIKGPSSGALVPLTPNNLTAEMNPKDAGDDCCAAPMVEVLHEGLTSDHTVGLIEEHSPQFDLTSDSHPLVVTIKEQERKCDDLAADMEASTSAPNVPPLLEVRGQVENTSSLRNECAQTTVEERKTSEGGDTGESPIFVARTRETLEKVLRDCNLHLLPLFATARTPRVSVVPSHSTWQLVGDGSTELVKKGCLVRVLINAPRKGVFDSGAIIYLPLPSDIDSYFSSSTRWQGFEDQSFKQIQQPSSKNEEREKQKRRIEKAKVKQKTMPAFDGFNQSQNSGCPTDLPELRSERCSLRVPIGIVTSGSVRGSTSYAAIGICEVAALGVLRAKQMALDDRLPSPDILLLARNEFSSMYRPALVSIVAETQTGDDLCW